MSDDMLDNKPKSTPFQQMTFKRVIAFVVAVALAYVMFVATGQKNKIKEEKKEQPVQLGQDMLMDDQFEKFNQEVSQSKDLVETTQQELSDFKRQAEIQQREFDSKLAELQKMFTTEQQIQNAEKDKPPLANVPQKTTTDERYPPTPNGQPGKLTPQPQISQTLAEPVQVGGTAFFEFAPHKKKDSSIGKEQYYLPPSFFSAKLLTGIDAVTSQVGADEPKPIMFMIDAPAVLPNHIREDLEGCFVIGNAEGNLGTERIEVLVINISCLSADGNAVIDQPVLGYVNDMDGKRDMAGNVVSKEGSKLAWLFSASIVGAAGQQASLSGVEQNLTALGGVNTFDPGRAAQRTLGESVQETATEYKNIVLDYIRQSAPVIEVGPLKDVTIVIQEGVWLEIKTRQKSGITEL